MGDTTRGAPPQADAKTFSLRQLAAIASVRPDTVTNWVRHGLVPAPKFRGRATRYDAVHALYVRAVHALRTKNLDLAEIKARLGPMSVDDVRRMVEPPTLAVPADDFTPTYKAHTWDRVVLAPGLELWVDREGGPLLQRVAEAIWRRYALERR